MSAIRFLRSGMRPAFGLAGIRGNGIWCRQQSTMVQDYEKRRKLVTHGHESENVMRMWFEWMNEHKDKKLVTTDDKRMMDSYFTQLFPFRSDRILRDEYVNTFGDIRLSKLLENLDALAGRVAYEHCHTRNYADNPVTIVTAAVDKILLLKPLYIDRDMKICGHVSWVGKSSMEVSLAVESEIPGTQDWDPVLITNFVMVARDKNKGGAATVGKLMIETEEEKRIFERGRRLHEERLKLSKSTLKKFPPTPAELEFIHDLLLNKPQKGALSVTDTVLEWTKICHPQEKNIHNKIFGGYLMREAFELAYACSRIFTQSRPLFLCQDYVQFVKPVEIGSILNLKAKVVRSTGAPHRTFQVSVTANVIDPSTGSSEVTNVFHFIFFTHTSLPAVYPNTYLEAMEYLEARRRQESSLSFEKETLGSKWLIDPKNYGVA